MTVARIMKSKLGAVITAAPGESIQSVAGRLSRHGIGALVVVDAVGRIAGMVLERDVVRAVADEATVEATTARDVMSACNLTCSPESSEAALLETMCTKHVRYLPVVSEGKLVGIVSQGDLVRLRMEKIREVMLDIERAADAQRFTSSLQDRREPDRRATSIAMGG